MSAIDVSDRPIIRKFIPTPEQAAAMESAKRSSEWFWQLPPKEIGQYYNKSLAVYECQVVAVAPTLAELIPLLKSWELGKLYILSYPIRSRIRAIRP